MHLNVRRRERLQPEEEIKRLTPNRVLALRERLQAIEEEWSAILRAFPDLGRASAKSNGASAPATRGRMGMSPNQRKLWANA